MHAMTVIYLHLIISNMGGNKHQWDSTDTMCTLRYLRCDTDTESDLVLCWVATTAGAGVWTRDILRRWPWRGCGFEDELLCSRRFRDSRQWWGGLCDGLSGSHQQHRGSRADSADKHHWSYCRIRDSHGSRRASCWNRHRVRGGVRGGVLAGRFWCRLTGGGRQHRGFCVVSRHRDTMFRAMWYVYQQRQNESM